MTVLSNVRANLRTNVVAYLALAVGLSVGVGGTSYAAVQLADGSVTARKLHVDAVTSPKILDHTIRARDLAKGVVPPRTPRTPRTFFAAGVHAGDDPVVGPDTRNYSFPVTLPRSGPLLVTVGVPQVGVTCSAGVAYAGLYVDEVPVPGSQALLGASSKPLPLMLAGTATATAGAHTLKVGIDCPGGSIASAVYDPEIAWSAALA